MQRLRSLCACFITALALVEPGAGVAVTAGPYPWEHELHGDRIVLLGEVHDNPILQQLRLEILERALAAGWRPTIAMEQFDREYQFAIERARKERPLDARYLIQQAEGPAAGGWNWDFYRPLVALALKYHLPLLAANLSRADADKIVRRGYAGVFDAATIRDLQLEPTGTALLSRQEEEVDRGHCHLLPKQLLPGMARAQLARDAVMASIVRAHAIEGVVLLAGNGHVRRDLGVPRWLEALDRARAFSVGFLERGGEPPASVFDAVVTAAPASRPDPCKALQGHGVQK